MKKRIRKIAVPCLLVFIMGSCVTINIYFPEAAVEKAADEIVEEVWGDKAKEPEKGGEQGRLDAGMRFAGIMFAPRQAHGAEADINVTTPSIRALKGSIQKRASSIKPYLDSGNVGIANDGQLTIRVTEGLNLKEKAKLKRLISSENKDRETLYEEIAKANNYSQDRIPDIKKLFAKSWIKKARKGWWVQGPDGSWSQKL